MLEAEASVGADEEGDLLPCGRKLSRRGSGADLDVVRMGPHEQVPLKAFHLGDRGGEAQEEAGQAHAFFPSRRTFSSAQIRSNSGSSSL